VRCAGRSDSCFLRRSTLVRHRRIVPMFQPMLLTMCRVVGAQGWSPAASINLHHAVGRTTTLAGQNAQPGNSLSPHP
jgi:hypothetical protein